MANSEWRVANREGLEGPLAKSTTVPYSLLPYSLFATPYSPSYAASAFAGFSGGVMAPDALISAYSLAE
jgi:hypothetical protein